MYITSSGSSAPYAGGSPRSQGNHSPPPIHMYNVYIYTYTNLEAITSLQLCVCVCVHALAAAVL